MVASNKEDKPKAQEVVITEKFTNQDEKNSTIVVAHLPSSVTNAKFLDTNVDSFATNDHDVDLIPIVELDGNTVLPKSPSDQGKIVNNRDEASAANSIDTFFREELNEKVVPINHAQGDHGRFIVVTDSNLSNFCENVIHDMQILGLVPTVAQQTMDFLRDSWANMGQKENIVNLDTNEQFQLVVPKKKKNKLKQHSETSKGFKVGASSRSPR
jgi:hypothetical protein